MPLTDEDLAYMRGTQDDHRPTPAVLQPRQETSDGMGGTSTSMGADRAVMVRIAHQERKVPDALVTKYGARVVTITMDLGEVQTGDQVKVSDTEAYEVVSDGDTGAWTTAQQVYGVRRVWP